MKRVLCPRCDGYVAFDERRCCAGESLFLVCSHCGKSFSLSYDEIIRQPDTTDCGTLVVLENNCCERQEFPFVLGDNVIGRRNKGTDVDIAIESSDADLERRHCIIHVRRNKSGELVYTLRDCSARSGTYLRQERCRFDRRDDFYRPFSRLRRRISCYDNSGFPGNMSRRNSCLIKEEI